MSSGATAPPGTPVWRIWVDTGGTFTDCIAVDPDGNQHRVKVLSNSALRGRVATGTTASLVRVAQPWDLPVGFFAGCTFRLLSDRAVGGAVDDWDPSGAVLRLARPAARTPQAGEGFELIAPEEAPLLAARMATLRPFGTALPPTAMRVATTRGTNALLEHRGAPTALFITRGFGDLLSIGTQQRPDLFALAVAKPAPLPAAVVEVTERLAQDGSVLVALDEAAVRSAARSLLAGGIRVAAVAFMHSYRNPTHERTTAALLRSEGFEHVSSSAELAPLIKLLPRAQTAVVDAMLSPVISEYLECIGDGLASGDRALHVMTSAGGLVRADAFHPKDGLLSGPAGGVVGASHAGRRSGFSRVIGFDMGGTSTDVSRFDGDFEYLFEHAVGDATLVAPALAIETVAAGGGSVCRFDGDRLLVGPESAGASPGPACYGAGGPLTVTDVNLLLGRLAPDRFEIPIDEPAARAQLEDVMRQMPGPSSSEAVLEGFLQIADERMADAIRRISLRRGYDPAAYTLVAFGGAGGQHACAVASLLGIATVLAPADAGLLSAVGLGHAVIERFAQRQVLALLRDCGGALAGWLTELEREAIAAVADEGIPRADIEVRRRITNLRFAGQETSLAVEFRADRDIEASFSESYHHLYGYRPESRPIEVESLRVVASSTAKSEASVAATAPRRAADPTGARRALVDGQWRQVPTFERRRLGSGDFLFGPSLVFDRHSAILVAPGWRATLDSQRAVVLELLAESDTS